MKRIKLVLVVVMATLVAMGAIATSALASASFFLKTEGIQGEGTTHVVRTPSGEIHVNEIPSNGPCNTDRNPNCGVIIT